MGAKKLSKFEPRNLSSFIPQITTVINDHADLIDNANALQTIESNRIDDIIDLVDTLNRTTYPSATFTPDEADYDLNDPGDITTTVTIGDHSTDVEDILVDGESIPEDAWSYADGTLTINNTDYLEELLTEEDQEVVFDVVFDEGYPISRPLTVTVIDTSE
jgi:hypothetical protein